MIKVSSLQAWDELVEKYFHRKMRIEERKDREYIYILLGELGLPHEKIAVLRPATKQLTREDFGEAVETVGRPYWISLSPLPGESVDRLTKLDVANVGDGWNFVMKIKKLEKYKVLIMQYPTKIGFKGSALVAKSGKGIAEFVKGDHHVELIEGKTEVRPMVFDRSKIWKYAPDILKKRQNEMQKMLRQPGHYEFQYGLTEGKMEVSFFDYNDELAYEDIDKTFENLLADLNLKRQVGCFGLPASPGVAIGVGRIILNKNLKNKYIFEDGNILVTDFTSPEMTPLMVKAGAIVTDLGGVTSHAAIVCRELGIPCIVGTKKATKLFKCGDLIIADANEGRVTWKN